MANAPKRLSKVAKELNVGISTIGEFLSSKGYDIEAKPNTKITPEVYDVLLQQYMPDKAAKEKSDELKKQKGVLTAISLDDKKADVDDDENLFEDEQGGILIKNMGSSAQEKEPVKEEKPEEEKPKEETQPATKEKTENAEVKPKPDDSEVNEPAKQEKKEEEKPAVKEEQKEDKAPKIEKSDRDSLSDEEGKGPRLVGKIDLDNLNLKSRPDRKKREKPVAKKQEPQTREPRKEEPKQKPAKEQPKVENPEEKQPEKPKQPEHHNTKFETLHGPSIVGKIDLPEKKKKKPVASSSQDKETEKKKKKRKRITKGPDRPQAGNKKGRKPAGKPGTGRHEPSEEEIQKEIKETLARLSGGGKNKSAKLRRQKRDDKAEQRAREQEQQEKEKKILKVTEFVTANEFANMMNASVNEVISACMSLGMMVSINQRLDAETLQIVAEEFGYETQFVSPEVDESVDIEIEEDDPESLKPRSPIVTVMGHVDHGKTSLLDYIRKANVIAGEAGGITQHIGAYNVKLDSGRDITFLDTPGHEAFTAMRARGAQVTDLAIIVISADDSVMPQTKEAINHAQAADIPIVFAFNKMDKAGANSDKIREELSQMDILVEDWGGKYQAQEISALKGTNVEDLMEKVLLEAEMLDLKANPDRLSSGTVIEAELDKGRGYVTTLLIQSGTLRVGDLLIAGSQFCRVRAMFDERGNKIEAAGPSQPVSMLGFNKAPAAGDKFIEMTDEREAKNIAQKREQLQREQGIRSQKHITLDEIGRRLAVGDFQELNIIVKGDVDGSVEALADSLLKLSTDSIEVNVIHKSVGQISDSDVLLATASDAIIVGFQVRPSASARKLAEKEEIDIRLYSVIYDAIEEVTAAMEGMLKPKVEEKVVANVEVRETFKISKVGTIAGCYVTEGKIHRNSKIRLIREGVVKYDGKLGSLKRFKDDVKEVAAGYECGLNVENYNDIKVGDIIEAYEEVEVKQTL